MVSRQSSGLVLVGMMIESVLTVNSPNKQTNNAGNGGGDDTGSSSGGSSSSGDVDGGDDAEAHVLQTTEPTPVQHVPLTGYDSTNVHAALAPPQKLPTLPPVGILTFIGLVSDYDVFVEDDQSLVITDLYVRQY